MKCHQKPQSQNYGNPQWQTNLAGMIASASPQEQDALLFSGLRTIFEGARPSLESEGAPWILRRAKRSVARRDKRSVRRQPVARRASVASATDFLEEQQIDHLRMPWPRLSMCRCSSGRTVKAEWRTPI